MSLPSEISVSELQRMHASNATFTLLDVREDDELATAKLDWAKHIAMGQIAARHGELDPHADIAVMCHGGVRSARVAKYLRDNGFTSVTNVAGGIDAWSMEIDPTVPRY